MSVSFAPSKWPTEEIRACLERGEVEVSGLTSEGVALLCAELRDLSSSPLLYITPTADEAIRAGHDLQFFWGVDNVHIWEEPSSPYRELYPSRRAQGERLAMLCALARGAGPRAHVMSVSTFARRVPPRSDLIERSIQLKIGEEIDRDDLLSTLINGGYDRVNRVDDPCSFSVRGDRIDCFPPHLSTPIRIEFFGDEIESICGFDPKTQRRSGAPTFEVIIPPVREVSLTPLDRREGVDGLINLADDLNIDPSEDRVMRLIQEIQEGVPFPALSALAPCFYPDGLSLMLTLFDRGDQRGCVTLFDPQRCVDLFNDRVARWRERRDRQLQEGRLCASVESLYVLSDELESAWRGSSHRMILSIAPHSLRASSISCALPAHLALCHALDERRGSVAPLSPLQEATLEWTNEGLDVILSYLNTAQRARLMRALEAFEPQEITPRRIVDLVTESDARPSSIDTQEIVEPVGQVFMAWGPLSTGFSLVNRKVIFISASDIFGTPPPKVRALQAVAVEGGGRRIQGEGAESSDEAESPFINDLREINEGDHVVHVQYGIGIYRGLETIKDPRGGEVDCVRVEFPKKETLLLPVYRLHLLHKFIGAAPKTMSGPTWDRATQSAKEIAIDHANELLQVYAKRAASVGFAYSAPESRYAEFEARFPFIETRDQLKAIKRILADMCGERPMDHLLCGDVGFGKTEVAMRAAMKALLDGKQVAILVPTTVLAAQHERSFKDRFAYTPYRVEQLSRFVSGERKRRIKEDLRLGQVHIIIGTHGLLRKDVDIPELGLLILDEEHRFGVRDKERLKERRARLDVLSMTATPIPRTLHMSLSGLRSMSVIATPPRDRLSILTRLSRISDGLVREAVHYELNRGGQVFFVHNRVQSISTRRAWLEALIPKASIGVAHGQMKIEDLEEVMQRFTEGAYNVLLCTTLIETGIDIPRANTMLIDDAHMFGVAQLYQLRGRVGRSTERARCYLLIPQDALLSVEARSRLSAIQKFTELGSGFHVASHDLELRGAGQLLGKKQRGKATQVGLDLYAQLLSQAVNDLNEEGEVYVFTPTLTFSSVPKRIIPLDYIPDTQERLRIYRRVSHFKRHEQIPELLDELHDRFGPPPIEVHHFMDYQRAHLLAVQLGLYEVTQERHDLLISFDLETLTPLTTIDHVSRMRRVSRVSELQLRYKMTQDERGAPAPAAISLLLRLYDNLPQASPLTETPDTALI